jgi:hypothetical protein
MYLSLIVKNEVAQVIWIVILYIKDKRFHHSLSTYLYGQQGICSKPALKVHLHQNFVLVSCTAQTYTV